MNVKAALKPHIQDFGEKLGDEAYIKEYILNRLGKKILFGVTYFLCNYS